MTQIELKKFLDKKLKDFNQPSFIKDDPISIPHRFKKKQDIEIAGFFAAIFAWGNRQTIINKSSELMHLMDDAPFQFIKGHEEKDLKKLLHFCHRTFNSTDLLYFISFFRHHYQKHKSLEQAFTPWGTDMEAMLSGFHRYFFSLEHVPDRTRKHVASPEKNSGCKRLNMFLRWMVRKDNNSVDFGLWENISPSQLICPIDLHVERVAKKLGLLEPGIKGWKAAKALTDRLAELDPKDPVKYDLALFGLGVIDKF
ncbi:MAG: TIGR02757 family protein [Chitinophagaceae bacterium]|nr:TIGR02757 family protein [Chitinophagaceae bacterium]